MAERPNGGSTPAASPERLTVDEMLKKYPKRAVERAIFQRDYVGERNRTIKEYEDTIARGLHVDLVTRALHEFLEQTPSEPPIDPDEPLDLDPDVLWRIKSLKYTYRDTPVVRPESILDFDFNSILPETAVNRDAILNAYRRGDLKVVKGEVSVWFAGNLVMGPLPSSELSINDTVDNVPEWRKKYGPGHVWKENPTKKFRQRKCQGVLPAADEKWTHLFSIRARLIGEAEFITINDVLDDTGSDYLELFARDDCSKLGLTLDYGHWEKNIKLELSSHESVERPSIILEVQLMVDGAPFGSVLQVQATISPGAGNGQERCSGMAFRRHFFTAMSPYGHGYLHISDVKTGVTGPLRAKPK